VEICSPLTTDELRAASGLGYDAEVPLCGELGVAGLDAPADVAACVAAQHACVAQRMVALETPRAGELLGLGGLAAATVLPCATTIPGGAGSGLGVRGKAVDACQQAIQKAGAKLVAGTARLARRCAALVFTCRQQKPADLACLPRARVACARGGTTTTSLATKVAAAIAKRCDVPTFSTAELLGATGAGFQSQAARCKALGIPTLGTVDAIGACVIRHHRCHAQQVMERELPRLAELLDAGGVSLP
jgi:hypothetical protein